MSTTSKRRLSAILIVVGTVLFLGIVKWINTPAKTRAQSPPPAPHVSIVFVIDSSKNMFPPAGPNYFDLARQGISDFLDRPGFPVDGTYAVSVIQFAKRGAAGYFEGSSGGYTPVHWFGPIRIDNDESYSERLTQQEIVDLVQSIEPAGHASASLLEMGIREATALLTNCSPGDESTYCHIVLLTAGEYRIPLPCPPAGYTADADCSVSENYCDWDDQTDPQPCACRCESLSDGSDPPYSYHPFCNRACWVRHFADEAHSKEIRISTVHVGPDWDNRTHDSDPEVEDPYQSVSNFCPTTFPEPSVESDPNQPDRAGFLHELALCCPAGNQERVLCGSLAGNYVRINPFYCFGCGDIDFKPGTPQDISDAIANWLCERLGDLVPDADGDGTRDLCDNCPSISNPRQRDCNLDDIGDKCQFDDDEYCGSGTSEADDDADNDGVCDEMDECPGGDDCLVWLWTSDRECDDTALEYCGCDCDHDERADPCQAAISLAGDTLPYDDEDEIDSNTDGWPDYCVCDGQTCSCDPYPERCDVDNDDPLDGALLENFGLGSEELSTYLKRRGWLLSNPDATADDGLVVVAQSPDGQGQAIQLTYSELAGGPWYLEGPGFTLPPVQCGPCTTSDDRECPELDDWGISAVEIDFNLDSESGGARYDIRIVEPCVEDPDDALRVHLQLADNPSGGAGAWVLLNPSPNLDPWDLTCGGVDRIDIPTNEWVTLTIIFNNTKDYYLYQGKCLPRGFGLESVRIDAYRADGYMAGSLETTERGRYRPFVHRGLQVLIENPNAECDCRYDEEPSFDGPPEQRWDIRSLCFDEACAECASANTGWAQAVVDHCPAGLPPDSSACNCVIPRCKDNCPGYFNPWQLDRDGNGWGDACEMFGLSHDMDIVFYSESDNQIYRCDPDNPDCAAFPQDDDEDGVWGELDNCSVVPNPLKPYEGNAQDSNAFCAEFVLGLVEGDLWQPDYDCDGVGDLCDNCPGDYNPNQLDSWTGGPGDTCDPDVPCPADRCLDYTLTPCVNAPPDGDGDDDDDNYCVLIDNCDEAINDQRDSDRDGVGDACDNCPYLKDKPGDEQKDTDDDGVGQYCDNCPVKWNPDQVDNDRDGVGDACDPDRDDDDDGIKNDEDGCPYISNLNEQGQHIPCPDNVTDAQGDYDGDGIPNEQDNCDSVKIEDQTDSDCDGLGDACDNRTVLTDTDDDGLSDGCDNCPYVSNTPVPVDQADPYCYCEITPLAACCYQPDQDGDLVGDACDNCCGFRNPGQEDFDKDGIGDACDLEKINPDNYQVVGLGEDVYACAECIVTYGSPEDQSCVNLIDDACEPDCDRDGIPNMCDDDIEECVCHHCQDAPPNISVDGRLGDECPDGPLGVCARETVDCNDHLWISRIEIRKADGCEWLYGTGCEQGKVCECDDSGTACYWACRDQ